LDARCCGSAALRKPSRICAERVNSRVERRLASRDSQAANALRFFVARAKTPRMKLKQFRWFRVAVVTLLLALPGDTFAQKGGAPKAGRYTDFHDVDEVTVVQPFQLGSYKRVVVQRLDTANAPLPEASDNSYAEVNAALANATDPFAKGVRDKLKGVAVETGRGSGAGALIVRARVMKSDPGSKAARYFGGFGAGAAKTGISGEIVDGATNNVLVRFVQERRSGFGMFGGGYRELLERNMHQIGGDVAELLRAF
jgi:hypothetical protein